MFLLLFSVCYYLELIFANLSKLITVGMVMVNKQSLNLIVLIEAVPIGPVPVVMPLYT